jgi:hypothetical protein
MQNATVKDFKTEFKFDYEVRVSRKLLFERNDSIEMKL